MPESLRYNDVPSWRVDTLPMRGCVLCDYGRDLALDPPDHGRLCRHPEVARPRSPVPTDPARQRGGACGPEAVYLTIRGVRL